MNAQVLDGVLAVAARDFGFAYPQVPAAAADSEPIDVGDRPAPWVVGPLSWEVPQGAFQLVVGATGSGKSTLLRNLVPALKPVGECTGELLVMGRPVGEIPANEAAETVGFVAQSPDSQIVCDTVWHEMAFGLENLGVSQDDMRRRVAEVAHFFGIEPWFRRTTASLSGGERQTLALASALVLQPQIIVLDEPTAQLDPVAERGFLHELFRVNRELGLTVIVATHSPETMLDYATGAVRLADGILHDVELSTLTAAPLELTSSSRGAAGVPSAPAPASRPVVELRDVRFRYARDADWVLRGFDCTVKRGSIHALVGGNGCGKTSILHLVAGVLEPERGVVKNSLRRSQALLPQDPKALFSRDTVADELREWQRACGYDDSRIGEVAARLGLGGLELRNPLDLSGGEQQLLALAKLVLCDPAILLLDEPTKGLDAKAKCAFARELVCARDAGVTIIMATHDISFTALLADEVTMVFDGEAACTQDAASFFADNLFYRPLADGFARKWLAQSMGEDEK